MARFFIDRPIFAWVIAILIMLAGLLSIFQLPIAQYPGIAPTAIEIRTTYPGASGQSPLRTRSFRLSNKTSPVWMTCNISAPPVTPVVLDRLL